MQHQFPAQVSGAERPATDAAANTADTKPTNTDARPAWLPEKFKTPEQMAEAYKHLEQKLGTPKTEEVASAPAKAEGEQKPEDKPEDKKDEKPEDKVAQDLKADGIDVDAMSQRFWETGDLPQDDRKTLTEALKKTFGDKAESLLDDFVEAKKAQLQVYNDKVFTPLGGSKESAETYLKWARDGGLDKETAATLNALWSSDDVDNHVIASKKLAEAYTAKNGKAPALTLKGNTTPVVTSEVYESDEQMRADQRDARYKTDPAFRAKVEAKVRNTLLRK